MGTWVFYVDESGNCEGHQNPIQNGQTPLFVLTAVALPLSQWRKYSNHYVALKHKFFKKEISNSSKPPTQYEVKGNYLCAPRNAASRRNKLFLCKVIELLDQYNGKVFTEIFIKNSERPTPAHSLYTMGIQNLSQRFDYFLEENNGQGFIIVDNRMSKINSKVTHSYLSYLFGNEFGRQIERIAEPLLFGDSRITCGLQIVDNISAGIYGYHYFKYCSHIGNTLDYSHVEKFYWPKLKTIEYSSCVPCERAPFNGRNINGYRLIDFGHRYG